MDSNINNCFDMSRCSTLRIKWETAECWFEELLKETCDDIKAINKKIKSKLIELEIQTVWSWCPVKAQKMRQKTKQELNELFLELQNLYPLL